jgi:hypothetical protein
MRNLDISDTRAQLLGYAASGLLTTSAEIPLAITGETPAAER